MKNIILIFGFAVLFNISAYSAPQDPLRGGDLSTHLAGPKLEAGTYTGKVVLFEYWGYN